MSRIQFSDPPFQCKDYKNYKAWLEENMSPGFCGYSWLIDQDTGIDHYLPKEHYPQLKNDPNNLILCTNRCNSAKSDYCPNTASRRAHKQHCEKIFNIRNEDVALYVHIKSDGTLICRDKKHQSRFDTNLCIFRLNDPRARSVRREYLESLEQLKQLFLWRDEGVDGIDPTTKAQLDTMIKQYIRHCSRRYVFYKVLSCKILSQLESQLCPTTKASFL